MHAFAHLHADLDRHAGDDAEQLNALLRYLAAAPPADAAWAVHLLAGGTLGLAVGKPVLRQAARQAAGLDDWLFDACLQAVGDLAETISLLLPPASATSRAASAGPDGLASWIEQDLLGLRDLPAHEQASRLQDGWQRLDPTGRWVLTRLVGSGWRAAISPLLLQQAIGLHAGIDVHQVAQRLHRYTQARQRPCAERYLALIEPRTERPHEAGQPYPFGTVQPFGRVEAALAGSLGAVGQWLIEWQHGGLPVQIVKRAGRAWIWTRDTALVNERFPEVAGRALDLPDGVVLEGLLQVRSGDTAAARPHAPLQQRLNRRTVSRALLAQWPVGFEAGDLLESDGIDRRAEPLQRRRERLETLLAQLTLLPAGDWQASALLCAADWPALVQVHRQSRARGAEGLRLRRLDSAHGIAWSWQCEPWRIHAVLLYAQADPGRRSGGGTEFTWALWNRAPRDADEARAVIEAIGRREITQPGALQLVSITKTGPGPDSGEAELARIGQVMRATTLEKFGPVRSLLPTLVADLAFEGVSRSARHKSGLVLRGAHMVRLRDDRPLHEADHLGTLEALLSSAP